MENKDSIFAGLNPAPAHVIVSAPKPPSPDQQVAALKQKMDALEKNILTQVDKKIGDYSKSPVPPPPPHRPAAPNLEVVALKQKMEAMEQRILTQLDKKNTEYLRVPAPPQAATAAPNQEMTALRQKMEAMEQHILIQLDKRNGEHSKVQVLTHPPAPPRPPEMSAQFLLNRIGELDKRLEEFTRSAMMSSSQMKNVEESKISARREIEELLKVVREQQKYSELDRQMHDQLEKSWRRVEELEKKLMDFYGTISKNQAQAVSPAQAAAEIYKVTDTGLNERLKPLESAIEKMTVKIEAVPDASRGVEARVRELSAAVDARLAGFSSEIRQLHIEAFAGKERVEDIIADVKKDVLSCVREVFAEGSGEFVKHVDGVALDGSERMDVLSKLMVSHIDGLSEVCRGGDAKLDSLDSCVKSENARTRAAVTAMQDEIIQTLRSGIAAAVADIRAENAGQLEKVKELYGLSSSGLAAVSAVSGNISEIEQRLAGVLARVKVFMKGLSAVNLDAVLGVSGALIRKSFEAAGESMAELEKETLLLAKAKGEIEANIKSVIDKLGAGK